MRFQSRIRALERRIVDPEPLRERIRAVLAHFEQYFGLDDPDYVGPPPIAELDSAGDRDSHPCFGDGQNRTVSDEIS